ncbi:hypothetical protein N7520_006073 [Penicillium odoratum]|uniref:uncharacterized protein n=1 Tax=Penicillium odoratum TaxID=1167516 RepID=UPI0025481F81|nr:uncharacterized protein N7520_006073 [Penicillium odoratum]KAJ5758917.1 hypothetical protein N7520_006073 [Penicillium odoratum]
MFVMRPRLCQALLAASAIVMGLVYLGSRLFIYYHRWNDDLGMSVFNGKLPIIPQYNRFADSSNFAEAEISVLANVSAVNIPSEPSSTSTAVATLSKGKIQEFDPAWNNKSTWSKQQTPTSHMLREQVDKYIHSILDFRDNWPFERVSCPGDIGDRYQNLRDTEDSNQVRYFFALNLYGAVDALPRLMSSILETVKHLGPSHCAISIVDDGSEDGTWEVLEALTPWLDDLGVQYFLTTSGQSSSLDNGGQKSLADLRNQVLRPLKAKGVEPRALASAYSPDAVVIFLDNVVVCPEDILELVFQHVNQGAQMTCAFDWILDGSVFYDVWESRSLTGNTFFEIALASNGTLIRSDDMFFDDQDSKRRYDMFQPLQVYSCWGGMATLNAVSFAEDTIRFRPAEQSDADCYTGEPMLLAKDLFNQDLGKILAVPSVNVAYSDNEATKTKQTRGYVRDRVNASKPTLDEEEMVQWQQAPPDMIKCLAQSDQLAWTEWTQST